MVCNGPHENGRMIFGIPSFREIPMWLLENYQSFVQLTWCPQGIGTNRSWPAGWNVVVCPHASHEPSRTFSGQVRDFCSPLAMDNPPSTDDFPIGSLVFFLSSSPLVRLSCRAGGIWSFANQREPDVSSGSRVDQFRFCLNFDAARFESPWPSIIQTCDCLSWISIDVQNQFCPL